MSGQRDAYLSVNKQSDKKDGPKPFNFDKAVNAWQCVSKQREQIIENSFRFAFEVPLKIPLKTKLYRAKFTYAENPTTLGQWIRKIRIENDLFAHELADRIGCHRTSLLNWERDCAVPTKSNFDQLKKALPELEAIPR